MRRHIKALLIGVMTTALVSMGMVTAAQAAGRFTGVSNPTITGTRAVGKKLTAKPDTVTKPAAKTLTYQWLRNGASISKATAKTYTTTASDKGKKLQVKVCYKRSGYTTRCVTSAKTAAVKAGAFTGVSTPRITGTLAVGKKLTAAPDTVTTPKASALTYQWLRNGTSISKATAKTYTATASDKGKKLSVKVCYKRTGYTTKCATSTTTTTIKAGTFTGVSNPTITGTIILGQKLTATPDAATTPKASSVTYQWLRNGASISKATTKTYTLTASDMGKNLSVKACYQRSGYTTRCVTSAPTLAADTTVSRATPWQPHRGHQSSGSTTRHASTARSGASNWPVTSKPRPSKRQKLVRSGHVKVASGMSRSSRRVSVRTPIIGRPRPSPRHRRAVPGHTTTTPSSVKSQFALQSAQRAVDRHNHSRSQILADLTTAGYTDEEIDYALNNVVFR